MEVHQHCLRCLESISKFLPSEAKLHNLHYKHHMPFRLTINTILKKRKHDEDGLLLTYMSNCCSVQAFHV
jgi:hypothetical protein